ncbi:MAG TPA: ABC transporter substrate-binding protein [Acetobacteraceae bacterium]|nr:ABC transporter substrate-binding protein [Acetobacteraceae bacterium]
MLRFVPQADLAAVDPMWTTAYVTRNHGYLVFDTLYGLDDQYRPQPQMVEGHVFDKDGREWTLTLRQGLLFHDGTPVLARDVIASIRRWGTRDAYGQALLAATEDITAVSDRVLRFQLRKPFPLLPNALGKAPSYMPCIMPERLARTEPMTQVTEVVGSGPYRFVADERVQGARFVYERNPKYLPRPGGEPSFTSGPKLAKFDRIEWHVIPDAATAAAALQSGEVDWWEQPIPDIQPVLQANRNIALELTDPTGVIGALRFNALQPPFDNPGVRRAVLTAVNQDDFMAAVVGGDKSRYRTGIGAFCPVSAMANDAGIEVLTGPRDLAGAAKALRSAGYNGEKVVVLAPTDFPSINAMSLYTADLFRRLGMNVDLQMMDWGTLTQRRGSKAPPDKGGWSVFCGASSGQEMFDPTAHNYLRGNGASGWFGWPTAPRLEELRDAWFEAPDLAGQQRIARELQLQLWQEVTYVPLGQFFQPTAYRKTITGVLKGGFPLFYNVRRV